MRKTILALLVSFLAHASVHANTYSDNNPADVWINAFNPSYTGTFTLAGYNPLIETITSGYAEFTFWDAPYFGGSESLKVTMGSDLLTHGSFSGFYTFGSSQLSAWGTLDSTGVLSYTVSRTSTGFSEFWLTNANLKVTTESRKVPEAATTSVLFGLGLIALVGVKRRFAAAL